MDDAEAVAPPPRKPRPKAKPIVIGAMPPTESIVVESHIEDAPQTPPVIVAKPQSLVWVCLDYGFSDAMFASGGLILTSRDETPAGVLRAHLAAKGIPVPDEPSYHLIDTTCERAYWLTRQEFESHEAPIVGGCATHKNLYVFASNADVRPFDTCALVVADTSHAAEVALQAHFEASALPYKTQDFKTVVRVDTTRANAMYCLEADEAPRDEVVRSE